MKALVRIKSGKESVLKVTEIESRNPGPGEIKVRMVSARINPVDVALLKGIPFVKYPKVVTGGVDGAGGVIETGAGVEKFKKGDQVFFYRRFDDFGTWAEETIMPQDYVSKIPANISMRDAGSITLPLQTSYESLTKLNFIKGETILIHGAGAVLGIRLHS